MNDSNISDVHNMYISSKSKYNYNNSALLNLEEAAVHKADKSSILTEKNNDKEKVKTYNPNGIFISDLGSKRLSILQDQNSQRFVYRQIDSDTQSVQKQFPYESELERVAFLREFSEKTF